MNAETVREFLSKRPFEPFLIRLSNGDSHEVRHPEDVVLLKTRLIIGYPETDSAVPIGLIHVKSIQHMPSAQTKKARKLRASDVPCLPVIGQGMTPTGPEEPAKIRCFCRFSSSSVQKTAHQLAGPSI